MIRRARFDIAGRLIVWASRIMPDSPMKASLRQWMDAWVKAYRERVAQE